VDTIIYSNEKRIEENEQDISPSLDTGNFIFLKYKHNSVCFNDL